MIFAADSHDVWIAFFACVTVGFGVLNTYLQQRNKNIAVNNAENLNKALAENTAITKEAAVKAAETHALVKSVVPDP